MFQPAHRLALSILFAAALATFAFAQDAPVVEVRMVSNGVLEQYFDPVGLHIEPGTLVRFVNVSGLHAAYAYIAYPGSLETSRVPEGGA